MRSKRWHPTSNDLGGLLIDGAPALVRQLDDFVLRPRRWWRETLLPIIYLVCESTASNPLDGLADRLHQARSVPHSRINGRETPATNSGQPPETSIRRLLDGVVVDLSQRSGRGRPLRFPHYSLALWLASLVVNHKTPPQPDDPDQRVNNALQEFIKERFQLRNRTTRAEVSVTSEIPWWVRIPVLLLPPLGIRLMRILWRPPRWAAGNRISSEHSAGSFRGLARKFMEQGSGEHQHDIQQAEIDRLLVDAFMEDLRRSYRRTTLFGVGRRRTTYPVLLIDKIGTATAGFRLLKLISESRTGHLRKNATGPGRRPRERDYFHPLLVITCGDESTLDGIGHLNDGLEDHDSHSIADINYYYSQWYRALANPGPAWLIPLRVPTEHPAQGLRAELTEIRLPVAPQPVMTFISAALLIAVAPIAIYSAYDTHCGSWYWEPLQSQVLANTDRYQCVGLGSSGHRFFDDVIDVFGMDKELAVDLKEVEDLIYGYNEEAIKSPGYLTVVYLGQLSSRDIANYRSELEQLRGVAVAQKGSLADRPVRVLLANGGDGMDYGAAAAEAIAQEAGADDTLVAVVGLGISRTGTRDAIIRLARSDTRIPTIGTVITATGLATDTSSYYHQVGPTNKREAEVGAFYAETQLGAQSAVIYHPDDKDDLYSSDLREQATLAFTARGFVVREKSYRVDTDNIGLAGRDACDIGREGVAFYAGRATQFFAFASGMRDKCEGSYPHLLGGDAISRFVLDGGLKDYPGLTVDYLSQASSLAWGSDCSVTDTSFFTVYRELFGEGECPSNRHGGSLLGHDALLVFSQGVRNAVDRPSPDPAERPSPDAVLRGIEHISGEKGFLRGASGKIDYSLPDDRAIPKDKAILVLRGQAAAEPRRMLLCGQHDTARPPPDDCSAPPG